MSFVLPPHSFSAAVLVSFAGLSLVSVAAARVVSRRAASLPASVVKLSPALVLVWTWAAMWALELLTVERMGRASSKAMLYAAASSAAWIPLAVSIAPMRFWKFVAAALVITWTVFYYADVLFLRYFGTFIPAWSLLEFPQFFDWHESVGPLLRPDDGQFLIFAGIASCWVRWMPREDAGGPGVRRRLSGWIKIMLILFCGLAVYPSAQRIASKNTAPGGDRIWMQEQSLWSDGLLNAHLIDGIRTVRDVIAEPHLSPEAAERTRAALEARQASRQIDEASYGTARGRNLILVQVESFQAYLIGLTVQGREVTPFLNRLSRQGLFFSAVFDQTADGSSSDAEFAALNSLHPLSRGAVVFRKAGNHFAALPGLLRDHGYATLAAQAVHPNTWNMSVVYRRYGFAKVLSAGDFAPGEVFINGSDRLADHDMLRQMVPQIKKLPEPFFAFIETVSSHIPFAGLPTEYKVLDLGAAENTMIGEYLHYAHYVDKALGEFYESLGREGLLESTVLAIYGDHRTHLPADSSFRKLIGMENTGLSDASLEVWTQRIPFIVQVPASNLSGEIKTIGGHIDIAPTLLHFLGVKSPMSFLGRPLVSRPQPQDLAALSRPIGSVVSPNYMAIQHAPKGRLCVDTVSLEELPSLAPCSDLAERGYEELSLSSVIVLNDLSKRYHSIPDTDS